MEVAVLYQACSKYLHLYNLINSVCNANEKFLLKTNS